MRTIVYLLLAFCMATTPAQGLAWDLDAPFGQNMMDSSVENPDMALGPMMTRSVGSWSMFRYNLNGTGNSSSPVPADNTEYWNFDAGSPIVSTPTVGNGSIYFGAGTDLFSVYLNNGTERWNFSVGATIYSSPAVEDDLVYFYAFNGRFYALWTSNGTEKWNVSLRSPSDGRGYCSPIVVGYDVFCLNSVGKIYSLNRTDGTENWNVDYGGAMVLGSISYRDGRLYLGLGSNNKFVSLWSSNGTEIWSTDVTGPPYVTPALGEDSVFFTTESSDRLYSLDIDDGAENWNVTLTSRYSSPAIRDDKVYLPGKAYYQSNGTEIWSNGGSLFTSAAVSGDYMVSLNGSKVTSYYRSNGTIRWDKEVSGNWGSPSLSNGLVLIGGSSGVLYAIGNPDLTPPNITSTLPSDQDTDVQVDTNISVTFSKDMEQGTTEDAFSISPAVTGTFSWTAQTLTFDPDSDLDPITEYTVTIDGTAENLIGITLDGDDDGQSEGSPTDDYAFTFTTLDNIPPEIVETLPADATTGVSLDVVIEVTFNESMNQTTTEEAFDIEPTVNGTFSWDINSTVMSFTPDDPLPEKTTFNCSVGHSASDLAGNLLDGNGDGSASGDASDDHLWSFMTGDPVPPQVTAHSPGDGMTDVPINVQISVTFDETMNETATEGAFEVVPAVTGSTSWSDTVLTFVPSGDLAQNTSYTVTIGADAKDLADNLLDGDGDGTGGEVDDDVSWTFTTGAVSDATPPTVLSVSPADGRMNEPVDLIISVRFSEAMDTTVTEAAFSMDPVVAGAFGWDNDTITLTFDPDIDLAYETSHTVTIGRTAADLIGLQLDGNNDTVGGQEDDDHSWSFTTAPEGTIVVPPEVVDFSPEDNEVNVTVDTSISVTFSKAMDQTSVQNAFTTVPSVTGNISWFGDTMTFRPDALEYETSYTVRIEATAMDTEGAGLDGNRNGAGEGSPTDDVSWSFTTEEEPIPPPPPAPMVTSVSPLPNAVDVSVDTDIVIEFNMAMDPVVTTGAVMISALSAMEYSTSWDSGNRTITLKPTNDLNHNMTYEVKVTGDARSSLGIGLDGDGDGTAEGLGIDDHVWTFTTEKKAVVPVAPIVSIVHPLDGAKVKGKVVIDGTASDADTPLTNVNIEIMFDESGTWVPAGTGGSWSYTWDTKEIKDGKHTIQVRAFDGGLYSDIVIHNVDVKNKGGGPGTDDGLGSTLMIGLIVVIIIVVVVALIVALKMRGRKGPEVMPSQTYPPTQPPVQPQVQEGMSQGPVEPPTEAPPQMPLERPVAPEQPQPPPQPPTENPTEPPTGP